jgi:hypothetical protein
MGEAYIQQWTSLVVGRDDDDDEELVLGILE